MIKERLDIFLSYLRLSGRAFEKECGLKTGVYASIKEGTSASTFILILNKYPELSAEWLMRGEGEMKALFIILLFVFSLQLARAEQASFESRANILQELIGHFEKVCVGLDGSVLENVIAIDPFATMENGRMIRCSEEAERLNKMIKELQLKNRFKIY